MSDRRFWRSQLALLLFLSLLIATCPVAAAAPSSSAPMFHLFNGNSPQPLDKMFEEIGKTPAMRLASSARRPLLVVPVSAVYRPHNDMFRDTPATLPQEQETQGTPEPKEKRTIFKVFTWVGVGFLGAGAAELAYGMQEKTSCSGTGYYRVCYSEDRQVWKYGGAADLAIGAVLFLIGVTKK